MGCSWALLGALGMLLATPGALLRHCCDAKDVRKAAFFPNRDFHTTYVKRTKTTILSLWAALGLLLAALGPLLAALEPLLGRSWVLLGRSYQPRKK